MMDERFVDKIEDLRHHTYSRVTELQKNLCPMVKKAYLNYQFDYWYEGYKYNLWEDNKHLYAVNEIPYCYDNELKNTTFRDTLDNLVAQSKVWPFLLFINGVAIRWSKINIIHDYDYSYMIIDDFAPDYSVYATIITFPIAVKNIRYGEDNDILTTSSRKGLYFDKDGKRLETTDFAEISLRLEILDENIYFKQVDISNSEFLEFEDLPDGYVPTLNNIITFNSDGTYNNDGPFNKVVDVYNGTLGLFKLIKDTTDIKWAILMYNTKDINKENSSLYDRLNDFDKDSIVKLMKETDPESEDWNTLVNPLITTFDFDHEFGKPYEENIANAAKYITRYDYRIWRDAFIKGLNIKSLSYTGKDFKLMSDDKGYVHFSRDRNDTIEDVVIMFVNHKVYQYMIDVVYDTNTINLPIFGILDNDHVEIIKFSKCNNKILDIVVQDENTPVYIHPAYDLEECDIMSEYCPDNVYNVPDSLDGRKQYIVERTYTRDGDMYLIKFENPEYYGMNLKIVPKRQFRYYRFKQRDGQYNIILPTQFNYCHDPNRYLVFINGKKLNRSQYTITIMNKYRPFDKLVLYIATILDEGDYVDIFYIPESLVEKYKQETMSIGGVLTLSDIDVSNYPTTYPFSKETVMVFINGLKVNPLDIRDVTLNSMLIDVDKYIRDKDGNIIMDANNNKIINPHRVDSLNDITIVEFTVGDKEVSGYLEGLYEQIPEGEEYNPDNIDFTKSASDMWKDTITNIINTYGEDGLKKYYGEYFNIESPAPDFSKYFVNLKSVLYDVVIDYYLDHDNATTGEPFVYDFEQEYFDTEADDSDTRLIELYPEDDKMFDYVGVDLIADTDDVLSGKKFYPID